MNIVDRKVVLGKEDCRTCHYNGFPGEVCGHKWIKCESCKGTGKRGNGQCRKCNDIKGYIPSYGIKPGLTHNNDWVNRLVCPTCGGDYKDREDETITGYLSTDQMKELFPRDRIKVYSSNRIPGTAESLLGGIGDHVLYSVSGCSSKELNDNQVLVEHVGKFSQGVQACKVANKEFEVADHLGVFTNAYGYTVRAVFNEKHEKLMELASAELTYAERYEIMTGITRE